MPIHLYWGDDEAARSRAVEELLKGGKDPLVFRRGSVPYRGFLEGRVQGDRYALLLHLSTAELKRPDSVAPANP